jgi:hypothetical protein
VQQLRMQKRAARSRADEPVATDRAKSRMDTTAADTMVAKIETLLAEA